jgi:hypothetical protein
MANRSAGSQAIYLVVSLCLIFVLMIGGALLAGDNPPDGTMLALSAVAAGVAALGLWIEARLNFLSFVYFSCVCSMIFAVIFIAIGVSSNHGLPALVLGGGFSLLAAWSVIYLLRRQYTPPAEGEPPDLLLESFGRANVWETNGVHFALQADQRMSVQEVHPLRIHLQNCLDAPCEVRVDMKQARGFLRRARLDFPPRCAAAIDPVEVGVLDVPLRARTPGTAVLRLKLHVKPKGGERVRHRRARSFAWLPWWLRLLGRLAGVPGIPDSRGEIELTFRARGRRRSDETSAIPESRWSTLWLPGAGEDRE